MLILVSFGYSEICPFSRFLLVRFLLVLLLKTAVADKCPNIYILIPLILKTRHCQGKPIDESLYSFGKSCFLAVGLFLVVSP